MGVRGVDSLLGVRTRAPQPPPATARVIRSDTTGVWVTVLGEDMRHVQGPCRGANRNGSRLPVGTVVLLVHTDAGPWVAAYDETSGGGGA